MRERVPIDRAESQSGEEGLGGLGEQPELLEPLAPRLSRRAGGGQGTKTLSPQVRADGDRAEDAESAGLLDARRGGKPGAVLPGGGLICAHHRAGHPVLHPFRGETGQGEQSLDGRDV